MSPIDISSRSFTVFIALSFIFYTCHPGGAPGGQPVLAKHSEGNQFAEYWYQGEGELNSYEVEQARYGELRRGESVMVFVTEDFSESKQVKLDNPKDAGNDKIPVMKLNHLRRFTTGVYDYSMMQSAFTPVDLKKHSKTLKLTSSSQDWCGHSFLQLNLEGEKYKISQFSYFESEGDKNYNIEADLLEDELFTLIRIAPEHIKEGNYDIVPATFYSRLLHDPLKPKQARITLNKQKSNYPLAFGISSFRKDGND